MRRPNTIRDLGSPSSWPTVSRLKLLTAGEFTSMEVVNLFQGSHIYMYVYMCMSERIQIHMHIIKMGTLGSLSLGKNNFMLFQLHYVSEVTVCGFERSLQPLKKLSPSRNKTQEFRI